MHLLTIYCHAARLILALPLILAAFTVSASAAAPPEPAQVSSIDIRPAFQDWGLSARRQGARGTCSVFTLTGALEYALTTQQRHPTRLSVEFLNWASNEAIQTQADGGFFSDLWAGFTAHGICPEADMPYQAAYDRTLRPSQAALRDADTVRNANLQLHWIKPWDVQTGLTDTQFAHIKQTLADRWPVCGGFRWPKRERWIDGVLAMAPPQEVFDGHSVLLVGFRDDPAQPGGGVFLLRNSAHGNDDGAMTYEYARAYMNDAAWIDSEKTPDRPLTK